MIDVNDIFAAKSATGRTAPYAGTEEPQLTELLSDDTLHQVMRRDGLTLADLHEVISTARDGLSHNAA